MDTLSPENSKNSLFLKRGVPFLNRRYGVSEAARVERSLERAVAYLVVQQRKNPERNYQEAIVILCCALGQMAAAPRASLLETPS